MQNDRAKILDTACGPGNISKFLLSKMSSYQVLGFDLAPNMVDLTSKNNPTTDFTVMDSRDIEQIKDKFDVVVCGFCTPYLSKTDVEALLVKIKGLLNPDGILYLSTMAGTDSMSGYQTSSAGDQVYIHYHEYDHLKKHLQSNRLNRPEFIGD
ncbi:methyltransferase domain-containing protein [Pseudoalteromonas sp. S16_S37]|uniref:methyltransferase domain-containing protein n=1 Tax=Pseudoalteromonas sp. S16_S37 TaxID=2720228 RepID=UPI001681AD15|nr:class I SAM-dependent methyltransferase [Pseudoalteromonas sp. S16_S37]